MHSWQSGGFDFDGFIGGTKDKDFVVIGVVVVVSVFVEREAGATTREGDKRGATR